MNAYVIDAIIGLSVVYKGFENINGFERVFKVTPNTKIAVLVFGLFHGLGLATKLQEFMVSENGLVANILSFNVGVEIGQILALTGVLALLSIWRTRPSFLSYGFAANAALMVGGFLLAGIQMVGVRPVLLTPAPRCVGRRTSTVAGPSGLPSPRRHSTH